MTPGAFPLTGAAAREKFGIEGLEARRPWDRRHEARAGMLHQPFHLTFVIALAGAAEAVGEQMMADQTGERPRPLPLSVAADLRHRNLEMIVE